MPQLDYAITGGYGISYSRLETLHACARKFELENIVNLAVRKETVTFSFGHAFGAGIQAYFQGKTFDQAVLEAAKFWGMESFWEEGTTKEQRAKKTFWTALKGIKNFYDQMAKPLSDVAKALKGYELAYFVNDHGKKCDGVELTFSVILHSGYVYEGHIDVVLYNPEKNEYMILELKTTSFTSINEAQYQNSNQALSYSVVLDSIAGDLNANSSYAVTYLIYSSTQQEFTIFRFPKSILQRANWLQSLMYDLAIVEMFRETGLPFPTNGSACFNFFSPCRYLDTCNYTNETLEDLYNHGTLMEDNFAQLEAVDFTYDFDVLVERQNELMSQRIDLKDTMHESRSEINLDDLFDGE